MQRDLLFQVTNWGADWAWGLPLISLNVIVHVMGLGWIRQRIVNLTRLNFRQRHPTTAFALVMGIAALLSTCLHGLEALIWAISYRLLNALPNFKFAMLYSLNAITSYGHANLALEPHWQFLGAMEALNGWLLFGLTTAFLFAVMERTWPTDQHVTAHDVTHA